MLKANSKEELIQLIKEIQKKSLVSGFKTGDKLEIAGMNFGSKEAEESKYSWLNSHATINYKGELLDVQTPTILGRATTEFRYLDEALFNDHFIVRESITDAIQRESQTYKLLHSRGFSTFESRQELLDGQDQIKRALLTKKIPNPKYTIDLILENPNDSKKHIIKVVEKLSELHKDHRTAWGDPWLGNTFYDERGEMMLFDFGLKPNPSKRFEFLAAKDIIGLSLSVIYRTKIPPEECIELILKTYNPSKELKSEIQRLTEHKNNEGKILNKIKEIMYYQPVFGMKKDTGIDDALRQFNTYSKIIPLFALIYKAAV